MVPRRVACCTHLLLRACHDLLAPSAHKQRQQLHFVVPVLHPPGHKPFQVFGAKHLSAHGGHNMPRLWRVPQRASKEERVVRY